MKFPRLFAASFLFLTFSCGQAICADVPPSPVLDAVKRFASFEFSDGCEYNLDVRKQLVDYSGTKLQALTRTLYPESPYVFSAETDPMDVVNSYEIIDVKVDAKSNRATATVKYNIVAQRIVEAGPLQLANGENTILHLKLKFEKGAWKVINPPNPHVSREAVSKHFRCNFVLPAGWYEHAGSGQWKVMRSDIDIILLLDADKTSSANLPSNESCSN